MGEAEKKHCEELILRHMRSREKMLFGGDFAMRGKRRARTVRRKFSFAGVATKKHCPKEISLYGRS